MHGGKGVFTIASLVTCSDLFCKGSNNAGSRWASVPASRISVLVTKSCKEAALNASNVRCTDIDLIAFGRREVTNLATSVLACISPTRALRVRGFAADLYGRRKDHEEFGWM